MADAVRKQVMVDNLRAAARAVAQLPAEDRTALAALRDAQRERLAALAADPTLRPERR